MLELDIIPEELRRQALEVGQVLRMDMDEKDGVVPKPGKTSKLKRFVIIGRYGDALVAALLINSDINEKKYMQIGPYQHKIFQSDYDFLDHDSYIDGFLLREFSRGRVLEKAEYLGRINERDLLEGIERVSQSPKTKPYLLKKYRLCDEKK